MAGTTLVPNGAAHSDERTAVNKDDMILISVDDHIVEPPDMFKNHLPKKYIG